MEIRIKDSLFIKTLEGERVVRSGTLGVETKKVVYFYDTTKSVSVGFPRDLCLEDPNTFKVSRTLRDREVSVKDVLEVVNEVSESDIRERLIEAIQAL